jgi:hypothetical protein
VAHRLLFIRIELYIVFSGWTERFILSVFKFGSSGWRLRLSLHLFYLGNTPKKEGNHMSFVDSLLVALFMMAIVFVGLFALYLFVTLFTLIIETAEHAAKHKKAAQ